MPKKQPRNSYYFYVLEYREEQKKQGITYNNLAEVFEAAGPSWAALPPQKRAKFEAKAKGEKARMNIPECKYTSTGVSLAELEAAERERVAAANAEKTYISNFVKQKSFDESILDEHIYLIDVNWYCKIGTEYLIGECTLLRLSLRDGVQDTYHELVNPGDVPMGYMLDVKLGAKELGLPMPEPSRRADYIRILATLLDYVRGPAPRGSPPPLYTLPDKVVAVTDFIRQLCARAAEDETLFRVYQLDLLFYQLMQHSPGGEFPKSFALTQLTQDKFKYSPGLACKEHEEVDKVVECTLSRSQRWAFTVLDAVCGRRGLPLAPGRHVPPDFHLPAILAVKDARVGIVGHDTYDTSHVSGGSDVLDVSNNTSMERSRTHEPLRMPTTDYSRQARAAPELSLSSDVEFPALSAGRGRGRSMSETFNRMKM